MSVTYSKIYQDTTSLPTLAGTTQYNISNTIPSGLIESFIIQYECTASAGGAYAGSIASIFNNCRIVFNGDQWFNFNTPVDLTTVATPSRLGCLLNDMGGFVAENNSLTAVDASVVIPCGINLPPNSRFELDLTYFALAAATTLTGNFSVWVKYGSSSNATIVGNSTSFPVPAALQGPSNLDNIDTCIIQALGNFGMTPTYIRGASGASQNGYQFLNVAADGFGNTPAAFTNGYYFLPLYDLDTQTSSVNLLLTTIAGAGLEQYTATPVLKLPTGGRGESTPNQTASVATGSASAILRRAEE